MAKEDTRRQSATPSIPIPPPKEIARIGLDQFFEVASAAALRALESHLRQRPQPEPWNPQIWVGIIATGQGFNPGKAGPGGISGGGVGG